MATDTFVALAGGVMESDLGVIWSDKAVMRGHFAMADLLGETMGGCMQRLQKHGHDWLSISVARLGAHTCAI